MRPSEWKLVLSIVVAAIFATLVGLALTYQREARLLPLVVGVPALLLSLWQVVGEIAALRSTSPTPVPDEAQDENDHRIGLFWLFLFTSLLLLGGLLVGGTIAVISSQRYWLKESWRTALAGGAIAATVVYVCFGWGFGFELFPGLILQWTR